MNQKIILASRSPRRSQLLQWAEVNFEVVTLDTDESFPSHLSVEDTSIFIAQKKATAVQDISAPGRVILAADTIVVWQDKIIGKPKDRADAIEILHLLSGSSHKVITGVVILKDKKEIAFADVTTVVFHFITSEQIAYYVDHYKPYDKAGAYAIQEWIGVIGIKSIQGDFYNVMGLPVSRVVRALKEI